MPSLSTAEYEIFKKLAKRALDSKYFVIRKELLQYNEENKLFNIVLEHGLHTDNLLIHVDYELTDKDNNLNTKIEVIKVDENKLMVSLAKKIDFYVTVESNVFIGGIKQPEGAKRVLTCGSVITGPYTICGMLVDDINTGKVKTINNTPLNM